MGKTCYNLFGCGNPDSENSASRVALKRMHKEASPSRHGVFSEAEAWGALKGEGGVLTIRLYGWRPVRKIKT